MPQNDGHSPIGDKTPVVQPAPQGLDWATLASQLGWAPPQCAMGPDRHTEQVPPSPIPGSDKVQPVPVPPAAKEAEHSNFRPGLFTSNSTSSPDQYMYDVARAGFFGAQGSWSQYLGETKAGALAPGWKGGLALGVGVGVADAVIDHKFFGDTTRKFPSVLADFGSMFILATPQPAAFKAAEMVGLHVLGKFGDKWI